MDPSDPQFKHGTLGGYTAGCRKSYPCPATPTCNDESNRHQRENRRQRIKNNPKGRYTTYVLRRLTQTFEHASPAEIGAFIHMRPSRVTAIAERRDHATRGVRIHEKLAAELDRAWAWFVHGETLRNLNHGTISAYTSGRCRCLPCADAASRSRRRHAAGVKDPEQEIITINDGFAAHVNSLLEAAGSVYALSNLTGLAAHRLRDMNKPGVTVRATTVKTLAAFTPHAVTTAVEEVNGKARVPAARSQWLSGTLAALGYPVGWQNTQAGFKRLRTYSTSSHVLRSTERALEALHARLRDRPATPADGLDPAQISRAKGYAARHGYFTPDCYDDDGTLNTRAIPGHAHEELDALSEHRLAGIMALTRGMTMKQAGASVGVDGDSLFRRMKHGLTFHRPIGTQRAELDHTASRARIREIHDVHGDVVNGRIGVVTATLMLGINDPSLLTPRAGESGTHPEVIAWSERAMSDVA